jgi:hypothetical protein
VIFGGNVPPTEFLFCLARFLRLLFFLTRMNRWLSGGAGLPRREGVVHNSGWGIASCWMETRGKRPARKVPPSAEKVSATAQVAGSWEPG